MGTTTAISVQNLTYIYRRDKHHSVVANDNITLAIHQGEVFGLLGPNGAGKSTLVRQLMGLLRPQAGSIHLLGTDIVLKPEAAYQSIGFLPQHGMFMRSVRVSQVLYFTGRLRGLSHTDARHQTNQLLESLELSRVAQTVVGRLSGGLQRLVSFASTLMGYPPILVLDEPTNALAPESRKLVWSVINERNHQQGTTCFLITHNLLEAERVVQRVAFIRDGQIKLIGTPGEIKHQVATTVQVELWVKNALELPMVLTHHPQLQLEQLHTSHYRLSVPRAELMMVVNAIVQEIGFDQLDDFRIAPPSLEDVYLEQMRENANAK